MPAINCERIISDANDGEQSSDSQVPLVLKSHNMACALRREMKDVTLSQSL